MNNKAKQIEEMAKVICQECITATEEKNCQNEVKDCMAYEYAKLLHNAGYRNEKETAREILQELSKMRTDGTRGDILYKIDKLAEKFGIEVE